MRVWGSAKDLLCDLMIDTTGFELCNLQMMKAPHWREKFISTYGRLDTLKKVSSFIISQIHHPPGFITMLFRHSYTCIMFHTFNIQIYHTPEPITMQYKHSSHTCILFHTINILPLRSIIHLNPRLCYIDTILIFAYCLILLIFELSDPSSTWTYNYVI